MVELAVLRQARGKPWLGAEASKPVAAAIGAGQADIVSRGQLVAARVPRWFVRRELVARRWRTRGCQAIALHNGPLSQEAERWVAVLEVGPRAALDGVTALLQAGMTGLDEHEINLVVPRGAHPRRVRGVRVRESRRFREADVVTVGIRRMRPAVAAANAARWARSDRQARLFLLMCVQQRMASVAALEAAVMRLPNTRRRAMLLELAVDLAGGVHSLGELDVAEDFRRRGFPEPDRQVVRQRPSGTQYLDCELPAYDVVLEIDGAGHGDPRQRLSDLLRDLTETAAGKTVLRIPLEAYWLDRESVLDRIADILASRGWTRAAAA